MKRVILAGFVVLLLAAAHPAVGFAAAGEVAPIGTATGVVASSGPASTAPVATAAPIPAATAHAGSAHSGSAAVEGEHHGAGDLPLWSVIPFVLMLLGIAVFPLVAEHQWESNKNKFIYATILGAPIGLWFLFIDWHRLVHTAGEYIAFITLLGALYVISGGIVLKGRLQPSPKINTLILLIGGVLASFMGTTGAAMVLIRPLLSANETRKFKVHTVVFFIFVVANCGGALTPLGDPPLFMGYLRGVPFAWTFGLTPAWATMVGLLLTTYFVWDSQMWKRESDKARKPIAAAEGKIALEGAKLNGPLLLGVVCCVAFGANLPHLFEGLGLREVGMWALAAASWYLTPRTLRTDNKFTMHPIIEVAALFFGIFLTMIPALAILGARGGELGVESPAMFYWVTGLLSSFLDNAPTYLVFFSLAQGLTDAAAWAPDLAAQEMIARVPDGILVAISLGAVFMGANTYIGNGPNFMVKAIADERGVKMPSFFGYMLYSIGVLVPLLVVISLIFI